MNLVGYGFARRAGQPSAPACRGTDSGAGRSLGSVHEPGNRSLTVAARNRALGGGPPVFCLALTRLVDSGS